MRMAKFLVTGAAGFIGRSIAAELLASGESINQPGGVLGLFA